MRYKEPKLIIIRSYFQQICDLEHFLKKDEESDRGFIQGRKKLNEVRKAWKDEESRNL